MKPQDHGNEGIRLATLSLEWTGTAESNQNPIRFIVHYVHINPMEREVTIDPEACDDAERIAERIETAWKDEYPTGHPTVKRRPAAPAILDVEYSAPAARHVAEDKRVTDSAPAAEHVPNPNRLELGVVPPVTDPPLTILSDKGDKFVPYDAEDLMATVLNVTVSAKTPSSTPAAT